jgi:hypothetical protein
MTDTEVARTRLSEIARSVASKHEHKLKELKDGAKDLNRDDWFWHSLLVSAATLGSTRGFKGLIQNKENYDKVTFDSLRKLSKKERDRTLRETLRAAKVRMSDTKATRLSENLDRISEMGGPLSVKRQLLALKGRDAKIAFLESFAGIGTKYSRNMMMDVYDQDFWESIAVDARIKSISERWGLSFKNYKEHEQFYLDVAHDAGLQGVELDRLMYSFTPEFLPEGG